MSESEKVRCSLSFPPVHPRIPAAPASIQAPHIHRRKTRPPPLQLSSPPQLQLQNPRRRRRRYRHLCRRHHPITASPDRPPCIRYGADQTGPTLHCTFGGPIDITLSIISPLSQPQSRCTLPPPPSPRRRQRLPLAHVFQSPPPQHKPPLTLPAPNPPPSTPPPPPRRMRAT